MSKEGPPNIFCEKNEQEKENAKFDEIWRLLTLVYYTILFYQPTNFDICDGNFANGTTSAAITTKTIFFLIFLKILKSKYCWKCVCACGCEWAETAV